MLAFAKQLVIYVLIIISHCKDPYEPISSMECGKVLKFANVVFSRKMILIECTSLESIYMVWDDMKL